MHDPEESRDYQEDDEAAAHPSSRWAVDVDDGVAAVIDSTTTYLGADVGQALNPGEILRLAGPEEVYQLHHVGGVLYCSLCATGVNL